MRSRLASNLSSKSPQGLTTRRALQKKIMNTTVALRNAERHGGSVKQRARGATLLESIATLPLPRFPSDVFEVNEWMASSQTHTGAQHLLSSKPKPFPHTDLIAPADDERCLTAFQRTSVPNPKTMATTIKNLFAVTIPAGKRQISNNWASDDGGSFPSFASAVSILRPPACEGQLLIVQV